MEEDLQMRFLHQTRILRQDRRGLTEEVVAQITPEAEQAENLTAPVEPAKETMCIIHGHVRRLQVPTRLITPEAPRHVHQEEEIHTVLHLTAHLQEASLITARLREAIQLRADQNLTVHQAGLTANQVRLVTVRLQEVTVRLHRRVAVEEELPVLRQEAQDNLS